MAKAEKTNKLRLRFYECEHSGDLSLYEDDVAKAGGEILESSMDEDAEVGIILVETKDPAEFKRRFMETDSFGFSNVSDVWKVNR